jgi:hypothetical protein
MVERAAKVTLPDGRVVDGVEVAVDETTERWTEVKLQDGTMIRVKMTVISAARATKDYDPQGNPIYSVNMAPVVAVASVPDKLRRKVN